MSRLVLAITIALSLFIAQASTPSPAFGQSTGNIFPTPNGQTAQGSAVLVPCGSIVNGQPVMCPPGVTNGLPVICTNCSPSAPTGASSNPVNGTIATTYTFQSLITQNAARKGCTFQNQGTHTMFFSISLTPTLANSIQVPAGAFYYCSGPSQIVITDTIQITGSSGDTFAGEWQ
jgi:hypothetical protein